LEVALAELQQHIVMINELVINPGTISKPGEVWGEIFDIKEPERRLRMLPLTVKRRQVTGIQIRQ